MLQCVAVCCSVFQCVGSELAVCFSVFQCVSVCCSVLQRVFGNEYGIQLTGTCSLLQSVAVCCSLQSEIDTVTDCYECVCVSVCMCVCAYFCWDCAVCRGVFQNVTVCFSVQCVS